MDILRVLLLMTGCWWTIPSKAQDYLNYFPVGTFPTDPETLQLTNVKSEDDCKKACVSNATAMYGLANTGKTFACICTDEILTSNKTTKPHLPSSSQTEDVEDENSDDQDGVTFYHIDDISYIGCFEQKDQSLFNSSYVITSDGVDRDYCFAQCPFLGFSYSGLISGNSCICFNNYTMDLLTFSTGCNLSCAANANQICGGINLIQIFQKSWHIQCKVTDANTKALQEKQCLLADDDQGSLKTYVFKEKDEICYKDDDVNDIHGSRQISTDECESVFDNGDDSDGDVDSGYIHIGCFTQITKNQRVVNQLSYDQMGVILDEISILNMNIDACILHCGTSGYQYAGLISGSKCFCDNVIQNPEKVTSPRNCNSTCTRNRKLENYCGGPKTMDIYLIANLSSVTESDEDYDVDTTNDLKYMKIGIFPTEQKQILFKDLKSPEMCKINCITMGTVIYGIVKNQNKLIDCLCVDKIPKIQQEKCENPRNFSSEQIVNITYYHREDISSIGCFSLIDDDQNSTFDSPFLIKSALVNRDYCFSQCPIRGYKYAGLQAGDICICFQNYIQDRLNPSTKCEVQCEANVNQTCGGKNEIHIFQITMHLLCEYKDSIRYTLHGVLFKQCLISEDEQGSMKEYVYKNSTRKCYYDDSMNSRVNNREISSDLCGTIKSQTLNKGDEQWSVKIYSAYVYLGCFPLIANNDSCHLRWDQMGKAANGFLPNCMNVDECILRCYVFGYKYAGLTDGFKCLCDKEFINTDYSASPNRCNVTCSRRRNPENYCGGEDAMDIYMITSYTSTTLISGPTTERII